MYSKIDLDKDIINLGLKSDDIIMIHSSFSSIKNIEGGSEIVLSSFKDFFKDGCLMFPTHTWASMKNEGDMCDLSMPNSCVGFLTNEAIKDKDFIRSNHPTHSVVAYGTRALDYIKDDINSKTPVPPFGSFGKLKNGGYILFIGAPLSKNTFIHSIEEYFNVPDRFTDHVYTFYTKQGEKMTKFQMPRHFNLKCPHISDNYEKLLPIMLEGGIARKVNILDSTSYLVDATKCFNLVSKLLQHDIHIFDDKREIPLHYYK